MYLLVGALFFIVFVGEGGVRIVDWHRGHGFISNNYRDQIERAIKPLIPYRIFGWNMYREVDGVPFIVSTHGELFALEKPENTFRIVAFGGSTTRQEVEGVHYPLRLQQLLRERYPDKKIEVINVGNDAYATTHMITLLAFDVVSWDPDFVILSENANDLTAAYFPRNYTPDYSNKYTDTFYLPQDREKYTLANILFHESSLYWFLKGKIAILFGEHGMPRVKRNIYGPEPPGNAEHLFRRNVTTFVTIAKKYNIPVLLATQPMNATGEEVWDFILRQRSYVNVATFPPFEEHKAHHHRLNEVIKEIAQKERVSLLDNEALFAGNPKLFIDTFHYTREGIEKLAEEYEKFFVKNVFLPY